MTKERTNKDSSRVQKSRANTLVVDLKDLKTPWTAWSRRHDLTPSEAVRRLIRNALAEEYPPPIPSEVDGLGRMPTIRKRLELRPTPEQYEAMRTAADAEGMSLPRWLQALIIVHLRRRPQFGRPEVEALTRSSQALLAIGRNINQIARNMHDRQVGDQLSLAQLGLLRELIATHTREVARLMAANAQRWL